jgi:hypothetical protein
MSMAFYEKTTVVKVLTVQCHLGVLVTVWQFSHSWLIDWLIVLWGRDLTAPMHLGFNWPFMPHVNQRSPKAPLKFQMAPVLSFLLSSGSKRKEPRYVCLSEVKASLRLKTWVTSRFTMVLGYTIHLSQKSRQTNPLRFPKRAPIKMEAHL